MAIIIVLYSLYPLKQILQLNVCNRFLFVYVSYSKPHKKGDNPPHYYFCPTSGRRAIKRAFLIARANSL